MDQLSEVCVFSEIDFGHITIRFMWSLSIFQRLSLRLVIIIYKYIWLCLLVWWIQLQYLWTIYEPYLLIIYLDSFDVVSIDWLYPSDAKHLRKNLRTSREKQLFAKLWCSSPYMNWVFRTCNVEWWMTVIRDGYATAILKLKYQIFPSLCKW
jgi:hypothetical protein